MCLRKAEAIRSAVTMATRTQLMAGDFQGSPVVGQRGGLIRN
jgi:hypothetical protein